MLVDLLHQQLATLACEGRDLVDRAFVFEAFDEVGHAGLTLFGGHHVELVEHQPARLGMQGRVVFFELFDNGLRLFDGVNPIVKRGHVDHMQQQAGALQVAQKLVAQASAVGCAFDEAGHIGHDKAFFGAHTHHAQVGVQGGEGVVGDFGAGVGHRRNKGGLARVGHAQQAHIGQDFEFELQRKALAGVADGFLARRAVDGAFEP